MGIKKERLDRFVTKEGEINILHRPKKDAENKEEKKKEEKK